MSSDEHHEEVVEIVEEDNLNFIAEDSDLTCRICQAEFLDPEDLRIHLEQVHRGTGSRGCYFCPQTYTDMIDFAEHFRDKHLVSLFYCLYCLRSFTNEKEYKLHERKHKQGTKSTYSCAICSERYGSLSDLRKHDLIHQEDSDEGYVIQDLLPYLSAVLKFKAVTALLSQHKPTVHTCMCCHFTTTELEDIIAHSQNNKKCKIYVCHKCTNVYKNKSALQSHLEKVCEKYKPYGPVECPDCKVIYNSLVFSKHKKVCKIIKCFTCGTQYPSMYELTEHQSKDHPLSIELATCKFCWKQCVGTVALDKHIERTHKPHLHLYKYLCTTCKMPFKHPQKLFAHYFTMHKDIEPYTCKICSKKFRIRKQFTLHIKLEHKSVGFVEFDENYHVFFTEKKSENPFIPKSLYENEEEKEKETVTETTDDTNLSILNMNSEISETEGNQTETGLLVPRKRKRGPAKGRKKAQNVITILSSDDEPLEVLRKKTEPAQNVTATSWKKKQQAINKKRFTCTICNKYCYTYQNYNHHVSLHSKNEYKKCIKCSKVFRSKEKLTRHMNNEHSSSKLTDTLKTMLEKRKNGERIIDSLPMSERFRRTIKKVYCENTGVVANIKQVEDGLSVQKFIENFMPEENRSDSPIDNSVTVTMVQGVEKKSSIKMTKFNLKPISESTKLSMPVKFKPNQFEKTVASIRLVQAVSYQDDSQDNDSQSYNEEMERNESIPEVAEEIMLEGTEETPKSTQIPHKIVIPKLPTMYKDLRIAHLHPQAPYYKIVTVNEVLNAADKPVVKKAPTNKSDTIKLPDGTKLVTTNPLAHLLGKTPIEKVMEPMKNRYYKYKERNLPKMLAEALSNLDKPLVRKKKLTDDNFSEVSS
uniref:SFRICE_014131 n=1 Tax=Spodoptera frugiperda TaxID=7108 RepID=A0A2H1WE84_SPOFR